MTGLAITCFLLAAVAVFFAMRPKLAFHLDEGWKFKDAPEPSTTYEAVHQTGGLAAGMLFVVVGVVLLSQHTEFQTEAAAVAAADRCRAELLPRFNATVEWTGSRLANPDEIRELATELGVEVTIDTDTDTNGGVRRGDVVAILDPNRPGQDKLAFRYLGAYHDQYWAGATSCQSYTAGLAE